MSDSLIMEPTAAEAEEFKIFLQQGPAEMDRLFALMAEDQKEIDRLTASSAANLVETETVFEQNELAFDAQQIYYETQRLHDEMRHLREDNEGRDKDAARERENLILRLETSFFAPNAACPRPIQVTPKSDLFLLLRLFPFLVNIWYNSSSVGRGRGRD